MVVLRKNFVIENEGGGVARARKVRSENNSSRCCKELPHRLLYYFMDRNNNNIAFTTRNCNAKKKEILKCRTATGFLRRVTSRLVYGRKKAKGPRPVLPIDICIENFNRKGYGEQWNVYEFTQHQQGLETLYYFGSDDPRDKYTLVNIDIDVQKSQGLGTPEGAKQLAEHYKKLFPGVYFEPSTNGKGQHGYLLVEKDGITAENGKRGLKRLEDYLDHVAKDFDVEMVEVKGAPQWFAGLAGRSTI